MRKKQSQKRKQSRQHNRKLFIALAIMCAVVAWAVYKTSQSSMLTATDSAGVFSYQYPSDWVNKPFVDYGGYDGPEKKYDWSKQSKPITLFPAENDTVEVSIMRDKYVNESSVDYYSSFKDVRAMVKEDYFAKILFDGKTPNGSTAIFSRVDYLGPPDAKVESFTDHRYYYDAGDSVIRVEFREKYHHDWPDDETGPDINNSKYLPQFEQIARSIQLIEQ